MLTFIITLTKVLNLPFAPTFDQFSLSIDKMLLFFRTKSKNWDFRENKIDCALFFSYRTPQIPNVCKAIIPHYLDDSKIVYYGLNDNLTNKSERFIVSEIIRKEVFELYKKEVPYSTHIETESFKNEEKLLSIYCYVYVETESQKMIVLGKNGSKIKIIGTNSRKKIEKMYDKKVFIDLTVKVLKWRNNSNFIKDKY